MYLLSTAKALLVAGRNVDEVRSELRITGNGDAPTNSYVEEVIRVALQQRAKKQARRRRSRDNRKMKRAEAMMVTAIASSAPLARLYQVVGERTHIVQIFTDGRFALCDCCNHLSPCSHVIAVTKYLTGK